MHIGIWIPLIARKRQPEIQIDGENITINHQRVTISSYSRSAIALRYIGINGDPIEINNQSITIGV